MKVFNFFKKKDIPANVFKTQQESIPIAYNNQSSQSSIYTMPKSIVEEQQILFKPQDWCLADFDIGRPLGRGKFGHVYLARQKRSKHIVALKVLSKKQIVNSDIVNQVRRQIQIHSHVNHENILKMFGFFFDKRKIYYILEYATGGELYKVFREKRRFKEQVSSRYVMQITKAIGHLHSLGIIHRDIKPENILICHDQNGNENLKISDFGWSVHAPTSKRKTMCGTIDYLSPQLIEQRLHDSKVDIWSIGVLAYELTAGKAPFQCATKGETFKKIKRVDLQFPDYFSDDLKDFLNNILLKDPEKRMKIKQILMHPWIMKNCPESKTQI